MINIAIDGPSGAGKSTIAKCIAKELNIVYLDTGAMYRALALYACGMNVDPNCSEKVIPLLDKVNIEIKYIDSEQHIFLDEKDVSREIREHSISKAASEISRIPEVRKKLVEMQREIASKNNVVLDGRDITSYVLPNATYKFFLTATAEERAKRRHLELREKGSELPYNQILADIIERDKNDSTRTFAPLVRTADSVFIDSTKMTANEVVKTVLASIKKPNRQSFSK